MSGNHADVRALGDTIHDMQMLGVYDPKDPRVKPNLTKVLKLLRKHPFQVFYADTPLLPLHAFAPSTHGGQMVLALKAFAMIRTLSIQDDLEQERLWDPDLAMWPYVFRWTEYMCPLKDGPETFDSSRFDMAVVQTLMDAVVGVFQAFITLTDADALAILSSLAYVPLRLAIYVWAGWPRLYFLEAADMSGNAKRIRSAMTALPMLSNLLQCSNKAETDPAFRTELLRITAGKPRLLFRLIGRHVETLTALEDGSGYSLWTQMMFAAQLLIPSLGLGIQDIPRIAVRAVVEVLRRYPTFEQSMTPYAAGKMRAQAMLMLSALCAVDPRALMYAIHIGVFPLYARIRGLHPDEDPETYDGMSAMVAGTLVRRKAVDDIVASLTEKPFTGFVDLDMVIANTTARRCLLIVEAKSDWEHVGTCCNIMSETCTSTSLRACPCGQALYCSTYCQRAHWTDGEHCRLCPFSEDSDADLPPEPMSPKDLRFLVLITRAYVEKHIASIYNPEKGLGACAVDLTGPEPTHTTYALPDPPPVVDWPLVSVQALYRDSSTRKRACKVVLYGGPQMRYRMLNQARFVLPEMRVRIVHDPSSE